MVEHLPGMWGTLGSILSTTMKKKKTKGLAVFLQHGVRATSHMLAGKATEAGSGASSSKKACGAVRGYSDLFNPSTL